MPDLYYGVHLGRGPFTLSETFNYIAYTNVLSQFTP